MTIQTLLIGNTIFLALIFLILLVIAMTSGGGSSKKTLKQDKKVKEDISKIKEQIEAE